MLRAVPRPIQRACLRFGGAKLVLWPASWDKACDEVGTELAKISGLIEPLSESQAQTQVQIEPLLGLETESLDWSVGETVEHLILALSLVEKIIDALVVEKEPTCRIDLPSVRPQGGVRFHRLRIQFNRQADQLRRQSRQRSLMMKRLGRNQEGSEAHFRDPVFGAMNSLQWQWFQALHLRIHRRQLEAILESQSSVDLQRSFESDPPVAGADLGVKQSHSSN